MRIGCIWNCGSDGGGAVRHGDLDILGESGKIKTKISNIVPAIMKRRIGGGGRRGVEKIDVDFVSDGGGRRKIDFMGGGSGDISISFVRT